jgi:hypothetical protein
VTNLALMVGIAVNRRLASPVLSELGARAQMEATEQPIKAELLKAELLKVELLKVELLKVELLKVELALEATQGRLMLAITQGRRALAAKPVMPDPMGRRQRWATADQSSIRAQRRYWFRPVQLRPR